MTESGLQRFLSHMGQLNRLGVDPVAILRERYRHRSDVLAGLQRFPGSISTLISQVEQIAAPMGCRGAANLDETAVLQREQFFIHQREGQAQEIRQVLAASWSPARRAP